MGNKLGRRRQVVDEKYTRPQGLYQHRDVDHKKLRKLILDSKLAPCYPGNEDHTVELEECPICYLYYRSLNRSRCCMKGICTECFLQMKTPNSARPTQCPFCKTSNYAVEYRGVKTKEEKGIEQIEEQRVIEAKIRMRQQEIQDEEERMQKRQDTSSTSHTITQGEVDYYGSVPSFRSPVDTEEIVPSQESAPTFRQPPRSRQNREDEFDLDLEDLMVMEAIWLSIQEGGRQHRDIVYQDTAELMPVDLSVPEAESSTSPSGGLACAIAALAERQQMAGEPSTTTRVVSSFNIPQFTGRFAQAAENYPQQHDNITMLPGSEMMTATADDARWDVQDAVELGTNYESAGAAEDSIVRSTAPLAHDENGVSFHTSSGPIIPENFEEQMMLAMAVSLAEARARTSAQEVAWQ